MEIRFRFHRAVPYSVTPVRAAAKRIPMIINQPITCNVLKFGLLTKHFCPDIKRQHPAREPALKPRGRESAVISDIDLK